MSPSTLFFLIACTTLSGCGTPEEMGEKERITKLLDRRQRGLEDSDPQLYLTTVSKNYNDGIDTYATIKAKTEKFKLSHFRIKIENRTIYIGKNQATVIEEYHLSAHLPSGKKLDILRQGVLRLEYEGTNGWKIVNGINDFSFPAETGQLHAPR